MRKILKIHPKGELVEIIPKARYGNLLLEAEVNGFIQILYLPEKPYCLIVNRDGKDLNLLLNEGASFLYGDQIFGPALIMKLRGSSACGQLFELDEREVEDFASILSRFFVKSLRR